MNANDDVFLRVLGLHQCVQGLARTGRPQGAGKNDEHHHLPHQDGGLSGGDACGDFWPFHFLVWPHIREKIIQRLMWLQLNTE